MPGLILNTNNWSDAEALHDALEQLALEKALPVPFVMESKEDPVAPAPPVAVILCPTCAHEHRCLSLAVAEITLNTIRENSKELM